MRIGFLVDKISFGGGEKFLRNLIKERLRNGDQVILYTWNAEWIHDELSDHCEIRIIQCPYVGIASRIKAVGFVKKNLIVDSPDFIVSFNLNLSEIFSISCFFANIPFIFSERVDPRYIPFDYPHRAMRWVVYLLASRIVFQTKLIRQLFPCFYRKSVVIHNAVDRAIDDYQHQERLLSKNKILSVGRLSDEKDFTTLIKAFAKCERMNYSLNIYGEGPLHADLSLLINDLGLVDCVFLRGHTNNIYNELLHADIFVLPSKHEGMPNALLEAMALGIACIATDVPSGAVTEIMQGHEICVVTPIGDVEKMRLALDSLILNDSFRTYISDGAKSVAHSHSFDRINSDWSVLFEDVLLTRSKR